MSVLTIDVETTITTSYKRKANPFDQSNWVVYVGSKVQGEPSHVQRFMSKEDSKGWLARLLDQHKPKLLVLFNGKFDILSAIAQDAVNLNAWMQWVAEGGQMWDAQLAEYLLRGMVQESHMMALDEVAPVYGGTVKNSEVKAMWEAGVNTPDIPEDLIVPYLHYDLLNTELCFVGQLRKARESGQLRSILLNCGALLYTIEAERNGMAIDVELGEKLAKELEAELAELSAKLHTYLPADLPFEFNWGSRHHLSALIFGGQIKYSFKRDKLDANGQRIYPLMKVTVYVCEDGDTTLDPTNPKIAFFKSGKNEGRPKTRQESVPDTSKPAKTETVELLYTFPGVTQPLRQWETSTPGVYSVNSDVIEALGNRDIPFLKDLSRRAAVVKDLGTYFVTTDPKTQERKGMLTLVQPDGVIHHMLNMVNTVTARLSSSNPNLQNLPKGNKSKVKQVFKSRFAGGRVIQSDFTSLEIYIQAIITGCKQLIADLKTGLDMHCVRVSQKEGITYEEAYQKCRVEAITEWVYKRTAAKEFSFQRAYGAGVAAIAESTGMSVEDVQGFVDAENARYPDIEPFYDELTKKIEASVTRITRRIPHPDFPAKLVELGIGYYRTPDGKLYAWQQQPSPKYVVERQAKWASFSPPEIKNYPIQGGGAEWAKAAMWLAIRAFYERKNFNGLALLTNQVHDATYADAHPDVWFEAAALLHACMESATEFMEVYFSWPMPVHVPSDTTAGPTMMDDDKIEGIAEAAVKYRNDLRQKYIKQ